MSTNKDSNNGAVPKKPSKELTGSALETAKLDALIRDERVGEHASVIREIARLQLDNQHLKRQNLRVWLAVMLLATGLIVAIGATYWWFPKYRYIPTTDNKAICEVNTQFTNLVSPSVVEDFAKEAVLSAYSYDYVNYRKNIQYSTSHYFTEQGRKSFMQSLDDSGNLERVIKGHLIMKSFATSGPQIESEGTDGVRRFWIVYVPMAIEFYVGGSGQSSNTQDFMAEVKVIQEQASALNLKGISVASIILKPSPRRN